MRNPLGGQARRKPGLSLSLSLSLYIYIYNMRNHSKIGCRFATASRARIFSWPREEDERGIFIIILMQARAALEYHCAHVPLHLRQ